MKRNYTVRFSYWDKKHTRIDYESKPVTVDASSYEEAVYAAKAEVLNNQKDYDFFSTMACKVVWNKKNTVYSYNRNSKIFFYADLVQMKVI